ncbi:MAG: 50S ribosomal protein L29 [Chloroflexi bacterium]|nr:50S ribosomal protein L29 [Chloroflexota bacterium]MYB21232.1 50S ribosomal protein L29 [Chloroflexota bacterium]MYD16150.1 50S ribosomal protein L29 [Chloroflexota bacterium]MYF23325.1 50S ribosomal protein L29 [Chloroflexota bacterium]MYF81266.1 50S ribosomal protein L29 [Chloroflexota bacterium]
MPNPLADEARAMTDAELGEAINESYREVFNLQFQKGTRQLQNPMAMRQAKRQVARLRTILRERQLAEARGEPIEPLARVVDTEADEPEPEIEHETENQAEPDDGSPSEEA